MPLSLILDVTVAVLLVVTIGYAIALNGKLSRLRNDRAELEALGETFAASIVRAEQGLQRLKQTAEGLQDDIAKAELLREDLAYLIDRGGVAADHLVDQVRKSRGTPRDDAGQGERPGNGKDERPGNKAPRADRSGVGKGGHGEAWRTSNEAPDAPDEGAQKADSPAERELLKALRSVR